MLLGNFLLGTYQGNNLNQYVYSEHNRKSFVLVIHCDRYKRRRQNDTAG